MSGANMKILVADDDDIAVAILRSNLTKYGYEVTTACNGEEALNLITKHDIRLVISDWDMPVMNGLELCKAIRRRASSGYVYVILLTSHDSSAEIVEGLGAGADDFIVKPFKKSELMARVSVGERILTLESREIIIFALAKLAESRDPDTGHHLERVQRYSRRLAEKLAETQMGFERLDVDFIRLVYQTSPLHDIGKVGIPDHILLKPGRLTPEEFEIMKSHTSIGAETLEAALVNYPQARFLQVARDIAAAHHERWDGKGYPNGLAGKTIPLAARIVSVADVYDALTSKRVYKDAFTHEAARNIIVAEAGKQFDPQVVRAFCCVEHDFIAIREQLSDTTSKSISAPVLTTQVESGCQFLTIDRNSGNRSQPCDHV